MISFFPRDPGRPLASVLIPTRGRPKDLCAAVDSLVSLAKDPNSLEFIFKADTDDHETISVLEKISSLLPCKKIITPRGRGYLDMHVWVNQMCAVSTGHWIFLFNDDARMTFEGWDQTLSVIGTTDPWPGINELCLLVFPTRGRPFAQEFIALRRETYTLLGHFSLSPHNDNWIYGVMNFCGVTLTGPMVIEHFSDTISDKTREESEAAYRVTHKDLISVSSKEGRLEDVRKVLSRMRYWEGRVVYRDSPGAPGWYWWEPPGGGVIRHVYSQGGGAAFFKDGAVSEVKTVGELGGRWALRE